MDRQAVAEFTSADGKITVPHAKEMLLKNSPGSSDEHRAAVIGRLDPDATGSVDREALVEVMAAEATSTKAESTAKILPPDEMNALKKVRFAWQWRSSPLLCNFVELYQIFKEFDDDNSGAITIDEVGRALERAGTICSDEVGPLMRTWSAFVG